MRKNLCPEELPMYKNIEKHLTPNMWGQENFRNQKSQLFADVCNAVKEFSEMYLLKWDMKLITI